MSEPTNNKHIDVRWRLASHEAELIAKSREQIARSLEILRQPMPETRAGLRQPEPPKE
jgi:hypothetical protein